MMFLCDEQLDEGTSIVLWEEEQDGKRDLHINQEAPHGMGCTHFTWHYHYYYYWKGGWR
jgi:hypothetical protein